MGLKMKKTILYFQALILILISVPSYSQNSGNDSLSVKDVIKLSVQNRPLIRQKEEELKAAQSRVEQQRSAYLPNVEGGLSYTRIAPIPAFAFLGENLELAPADNYDFHVFVHQTLYDFGKRDTQFDLVQSQKESILDNEEMIKSDLSNSAVKIFYGILFLDKSIAVKDTQSASLNEHLTITDERIKSGTATDYDVLATKTKMSEIENEKIDLMNEKNKLEIALKELIGIDRKKPVNIKGNFYLPVISSGNDSLINSALNQRIEFKLAFDYQNTAKIQKQLIGLSDRPVVSADAGYGFKNGYEPNINVLRGNWFLGASVGIPIFNGNLTNKRETEAEINIGVIDQRIDQMKDNVATEIYQSLSDLKSSILKFNSTQRQIEYARKSLERVKVQYQSGSGTNLDVLDAETALTQARLLNIQSLYKSVLGYYAVKKAAGDKIYN
jgi:outer membrane protein TolC